METEMYQTKELGSNHHLARMKLLGVLSASKTFFVHMSQELIVAWNIVNNLACSVDMNIRYTPVSWKNKDASIFKEIFVIRETIPCGNRAQNLHGVSYDINLFNVYFVCRFICLERFRYHRYMKRVMLTWSVGIEIEKAKKTNRGTVDVRSEIIKKRRQK